MTFSAVLLAGGESRRMGRDKATMEFEGEPLWKRQLELLRALLPEKIFVSARTRPEWLPGDVELLLDDLPSRGPLSGLTKALAAMRTTHLISLAVDMPFMTVKELRKLSGGALENRGLVRVIGKRAEPLAAVYPAHAAADFKTALAGDDFSLQRLVVNLMADHKIAVRPVATDAVDLYRSVNEPEFDA
jgi:molybdopterin-guanine dinucleotide biosynthesis protein A